MATRADLNKSYSRMTEATEATRRAVDRVDESVKANTRATWAGNLIAVAAAQRAEVNAKKTHSRLDAIGGKIDEMNQAVISKLDQIDGGIKSLTAEVRVVQNQTEDLKNISFAQWRDGPGKPYWQEYRPLGRKLLKEYDQLSFAWRHLVAQRVSHVIDHYDEWKEPEWRSDSVLDGRFYPYPQFPNEPREVPSPPGNLEKLSQKPYLRFATVVISTVLFLFGMVGVSAVYGGVGLLYEEYRAAQQIEEYKDDENPALYPFLKYVHHPYECPTEDITFTIERAINRTASNTAEHQAWERAAAASPEQMISACEFSREMAGVNADGSVNAVDGFGRGKVEENLPKLALFSGLVLPALYFLYLWSRNKKIAQNNQKIDELVTRHRREVQTAHDEWLAQRDRIAEQWARKNTAAGKEMQRRFTTRLGVPLTGKGASEYWAAPTTRNEVYKWVNILEQERVNPPAVSELRRPSPIELNPQMPDWYRQRFESKYREIVSPEF